ncbi:ATP-dependent helicase [Patescibacteria group bacterium]|nr:MAG: ATP-dependent helicase [Patescibacteria group bacterium]
MAELNKSQKSAVEYVGGPLLIVAGAGTGKTTVITKKIAHLIEQNLAKPEGILALAFNDKAADEIQTRVDAELELGYVETHISTFHAFCQKLLETYGLDIGISNQFKVLTQTDAWILVRKNLDKFNLDYYRPLGNPTRHIHELIKHFSKCKDELITPNEYLEYAENVELDKDNKNTGERTRLTEVANAYHAYNQLLLDNNVLDFGDLIFYANKLLAERPKILDGLRKQFKYILVDEFQDVNYAQYELVQMLSHPPSVPPSGRGGGHGAQLTAVGDDDQSIYAFRGASVSNILRFKDDYPKCKEIVLTENYRSGQKILDICYKSIQNNNPDRLEAKLKIDKKLKVATPPSPPPYQGGEVIHIHCATLEQEASAVAQEISRLKKSESEANWDDFAILVRANSHADIFVNALANAGIPCEFWAASGLYHQPIVLDCFNFFKLITNYHESTAIYRLLRLPFVNFKENDLQKITYNAHKKTVSYYEALKRGAEFGLSTEGAVIADKIISLIHDGMKSGRFEKPHRVLYDFLDKSGYLKYLAHEENEGNANVIRQIYQLTDFFEFIKKYEQASPDANVYGLMEHMEYLLDSGEEGAMRQQNDTPDSVNIFTVHKAKGLEFKYVFMVNLVEDRFPSRKKSEPIEIPLPLVKEKLPEGDSHLQEERRLFYVAATRAKERLYFTSADDYGGARKKKISRFLDELGYKAGSIVPQGYGAKMQYVSIGLPAATTMEPAKGEFVYAPPKIFSFSQIKSYNNCPYQYKLASIIHLPQKQSHYFSFGNSMHNTLLEFYKRVQALNNSRQESLFGITNGSAGRAAGTIRLRGTMEPTVNSVNNEVKAPPLDELLGIYQKNWIDEWYLSKKQKDEYFSEGKKMLAAFYESNKDRWTVPVALEGAFKIKIGEYFLAGRMDRVDKLPDGSLEIIDYKTGESKETAAGEEKEQLMIYQMAAEQLSRYKEIGRAGKLTLYYLRDNLPVSFIGEEKELEKIKTKLLGVMEKIIAGDFRATPEKFVCKNCHFRDICEFRV